MGPATSLDIMQVGIPYGRLSALIQEAIPVGLQHASGLELMPKEQCLIKEDDSIILLQPSSKSTDLKGAARFQELNVSLESMSGCGQCSDVSLNAWRRSHRV